MQFSTNWATESTGSSSGCELCTGVAEVMNTNPWIFFRLRFWFLNILLRWSIRHVFISVTTDQICHLSYFPLDALWLFAIIFLHTAIQLTNVFDALGLQDFPFRTELSFEYKKKHLSSEAKFSHHSKDISDKPKKSHTVYAHGSTEAN